MCSNYYLFIYLFIYLCVTTAMMIRYGATACMGFIYIKPSTASKRLWSHLLNQRSNKDLEIDDQRVFNDILRRNNSLQLEYARMSVFSDHVDQGYFSIDTDKTSTILNITFMAHSSIIRHCHKRGITSDVILNATIAHCTYIKRNSTVEINLKLHGLWRLRPHIKHIARSSNLSEYLSAIASH